jgi:hypothetical protein
MKVYLGSGFGPDMEASRAEALNMYLCLQTFVVESRWHLEFRSHM